jgi:drug/metabolite transporter (DMT)-like permease
MLCGWPCDVIGKGSGRTTWCDPVEPMSARRTIAVLALVFLATAWGAIPLIVREDIAWQSLVAGRVWLGALTMLTVMAVSGRLRLPATHRRQVATAGVLLAVHWATFFWAIKLVTVAVVLSVVYLGMVGAAVLAPRVLGEMVSPRVYGALGTAFAGVVIVVVFDSVEPGGAATSIAGLAIALVSAVTVAGLMLVSKVVVGVVGPLAVTTGELMVAALVLSPWLPGAARATIDHPVSMLTLGVGITGFGFLVYWSSMRELPLAVVSVLMHIEPASAVVLALLFLDENPVIWQWLGIGLVIAGGLLAARDSAEEEVLGAPANL